jgi:hypothetical protein
MRDELADEAAARGVEREPVVGQQSLGHAVGGHCLVEDRDRVLAGLTGCDMGGEGVAEVIVEELEDHALASAGQHVLGRVELPARVRRRVDEPPPGRARLLLRLQASNSCLTKIRANDAVEGTCSRPIARIFSCTLIGLWSRPEASSAARTATACSLTSSVSFDGFDPGRLDLGSSTAADPPT